MRTKLIAQLYQKFPGLKRSNVDQETIIQMAQACNEWEDVKQRAGTEQVRHYLDAIESAPVGIYQIDFNQNKIVFVNKIVLDYLGYSREQMLSLDPLSIIAEEYRPVYIQRFREVFGSDKSFDRVEVGIITREGSKLWADLEVRFLRDSSGQIYAGNVAAIDITDRKLAEINLERANRRLRAIIDSIPGLMHIVGRDYKIIEASQKMKDVFADGKEEVEGLNCFKVFKGLDDNCPECVVKEAIRTAETQTRFSTGLENKVSNSYYKIYATPIINEDKQVEEVVELFVDILDIKKSQDRLKESQQKLRSILEATPVAIEIIDLEGNVIDLNRASVELHGLDDRSQILGVNIFEQIPDHQKKNEAVNNLNQVYQGTTLKNIRTSVFHRTKGTVEVESFVRALKDANDTVIGYVISSQDITERLEMQNAIEQNLQEKEVLLREVHHRVKNNLAIINSLINLQIENNTSQDPKQVLMDANSRIMALATIHTKIYESEQLESIFLDEYLNEIIDIVLENYLTYEYAIDLQRSIDHVRISIDDAVPYALIINEILTNSIKHAFPDKKGRISINIQADQKGQVELIRVSDDGIGIELKSNKGFGNLLITQLAQQVDMQASLSSEFNKGTKWTLRNISTVNTQTPQYRIGSNTVYLVEDESIIALDLKNKLEKMGLEVLKISARGEEAIEDIVKMEVKPALMIMDINLKGDKNGIETAAALKQFGIPIIFRSGYSTKQIKEEIKAVGLDRYDIIGKSIQDQAFQETIFKYLQEE